MAVAREVIPTIRFYRYLPLAERRQTVPHRARRRPLDAGLARFQRTRPGVLQLEKLNFSLRIAGALAHSSV